MKISLNGAWHEIDPATDTPSATEPTLEAVLTDLGFKDSVVATAINGEFIAANERTRTAVREGDRLEVLAPMQGG
jgi:sulfur carrier protein